MNILYFTVTHQGYQISMFNILTMVDVVPTRTFLNILEHSEDIDRLKHYIAISPFKVIQGQRS